MNITYRVADDTVTLERMVDLEIDIWGLRPRDAVPSDMFHALAANGGVLLAAEVDQRLVGLCVGLPARRGTKWLLWSYMAGVHPDFQGHGIGYELKQLQRRWAREHDYPEIGWTFDPLQRGNANFNMHRLGATANIYHVDYYGEMTDEINAGLPSDRLEVAWKTKDRQKRHPVNETKLRQAPFLVAADSRGCPKIDAGAAPSTITCVEIPANLAQLKRDDQGLALDWRLAVREALQSAFERGYTIIDFTMVQDRCAYVLAAPVPWFMYVAECSDGSLYTGIALDVVKRIKQHNAGRGAAYTATRRPVRCVAAWRYPDRGAALRAEAAFKKKRREEKQWLILARTDFMQGVHEVES